MEKSVKSISGLIRHVNTWNILIILPSCQPSKLISILEDNMTNCLDLPSDKKSISQKAPNYNEEGIGSVGNNNEDIRPVNINQ